MPSSVLADPTGVLVGTKADSAAGYSLDRYQPTPKRDVGRASVLLGESEFRPSTLIAAVYAAIIGFPQVFGLYYNKDVVAAAGIEAPQTFDELAAAFGALAERFARARDRGVPAAPLLTHRRVRRSARGPARLRRFRLLKQLVETVAVS